MESASRRIQLFIPEQDSCSVDALFNIDFGKQTHKVKYQRCTTKINLAESFGGFIRIFYKTILPTDAYFLSVYPEINLGAIDFRKSNLHPNPIAKVVLEQNTNNRYQ